VRAGRHGRCHRRTRPLRRASAPRLVRARSFRRCASCSLWPVARCARTGFGQPPAARCGLDRTRAKSDSTVAATGRSNGALHTIAVTRARAVGSGRATKAWGSLVIVGLLALLVVLGQRPVQPRRGTSPAPRTSSAATTCTAIPPELRAWLPGPSGGRPDPARAGAVFATQHTTGRVTLAHFCDLRLFMEGFARAVDKGEYRR
jgi:hypothetical protein